MPIPEVPYALPRVAIRNNHGKLVLAERPLLYDLEKDRKETTDVAADHPEVVSKMKATLEQYKAQGWSTFDRWPKATGGHPNK